MNWEFLKLSREGRSRQGGAHEETGQNGKNGAEVRMLKPFDARALGSARETVSASLDAFETSLQEVSRLPEHFRQVMGPVENALNSMALLRNRLEAVEGNFAAEQRKSQGLAGEVGRLQEDIERLTFSLKSEENNKIALREQNTTLEQTLASLRQEHAELTARVNRLEPQLRETQTLKDAFESELADLRKAKSVADNHIETLQSQINSALDELANRENLYATLQAAHAKQGERLDETTKTIADLEASFKSASDKFSFASSALVRERNAARALRAENEQLYKERDETKLQFESQVEAARARYDFVEKMLQESRARFQEETRQLSLARRERAERDREIGRLTLALETAQRETAELRAQIAAATEQASTSSTLLAAEIEQRRRLELDIDMLRAENSGLNLKLKALSDTAKTIEATVQEATLKYQGKIAQFAAENEQLRAQINAARNEEHRDYDKEFDFLFSDRKPDDDKDNIVPIR